MEFLPGGDLYSLLQKLGSIDEQSTKYYILQILNALQYLHSNGIIHRDLKPDNILVSADGRLKLSDFGLSYIGVIDNQSTENSPLSKAKSIVGTPDYIAPEIILNESHTVTADYWSLGVILYECLVGAPPFHGSSEQETFDNIVSNNYQIDDEFDLSKKAIDLISRLLTVNPAERLGSRDINDIINHPFFIGVSVDDDPPFKPDLASEEDTDYFDTRYSFSEKEESTIVADIASSCNNNTNNNTNNNNLVKDNADAEGEKEGSKIISSFESVSVKSLAEETRMAVKRKRSRSFAMYQSFGGSSGNISNNNILSPSMFSSNEFDFLSSSSTSSAATAPSSAPKSRYEHLQNSILQSSIHQTPQMNKSPPQTPHFNKSLPPSFVIPPTNSPPQQNCSNVKPLINTSHAETLVIPFQKQPARNFSRRKRGRNSGCGSFTIGGNSMVNDTKKKSQTNKNVKLAAFDDQHSEVPLLKNQT